MPVELKVPEVGESISEVVVSEWLKAEGDVVAADESVAELESDKATVELPAPVSGTLIKLLKQKGETAAVGEVIALIEAGNVVTSATTSAAAPVMATPPAPAGNGQPTPGFVMPAAARELAQRGLTADAVAATGPGGRVLKEDVLRQAAAPPATPAATTAPASRPSIPVASSASGNRIEEIVPMTPMRRTIAERLVASQQQAALLTTFNEIDLGAVMELRRKYQELFTARYGIKLGFMSFFVKAAIDALKQYPQVNAEIRGTDIVYKNYYDISIAVSGGKGLVVPVVRNAERLSFAETELVIADFSERAQKNRIDLEELKGGTFTISNGGIFGSLMSTPIVNPPQVAVLGLHAIQERPVARAGQVVIRPMMYVALTYDHRIIDGRESVTFLKRIKDAVEEPSRMLLEI